VLSVFAHNHRTLDTSTTTSMAKRLSHTIVKHGSAAHAFALTESEIPPFQSGKVRVEVEAFGINFADVMARKGLYQDAPPPPFVAGYEAVGRTMDAATLNGTEYPAGTRVLAFTRFGGYSTHVVAEELAVQPIPDEMPAGDALALAVQYCTAYHMAYECVNIFPEDHVLVQAAAGGVGIALVQLLRLKGCIIYGTAGSEKKLELLRQQGVHHPINYNTHGFAKAVREKLGKRGLDVVFDSLGGKSFATGFRSLGKGGRIVGFGAAEQVGGPLQLWSTLKMAANFGIYSPIQLLMNSKGMIGVNMLHVADDRPHVLARAMRSVIALRAEGKISPVVGGTFPASELAEAHRFVEARQSTGKVVVTWG
jgi:NADPH:quinone reductase-like Zn-dependent oxidoreductase